tara:strand:+ start:44 stop:805 length:762 start_codon:yes stop_codon:yes gene_type:complete
MVNYHNSKIYKITCNETGEVYYGSTTQKNLASRMTAHRKDDSKLLSLIIIQRNNYGYSLVENFSCKNSEELHQKLRFYIDNNVCINKLNKTVINNTTPTPKPIQNSNPITNNNRCEACELRKSQNQPVIPSTPIKKELIPREHITSTPISHAKHNITQKEPIKKEIISTPISHTHTKHNTTQKLPIKKNIIPSNSIDVSQLNKNINTDVLKSRKYVSPLPPINEIDTVKHLYNHNTTSRLRPQPKNNSTLKRK